MDSMFDFMAALLFLATAGLFLVRIRHEDPPLAPYLLVAAVSVVGNLLGNHGGGVAASTLMMASAFFVLHLASQPFHEETEDAN